MKFGAFLGLTLSVNCDSYRGKHSSAMGMGFSALRHLAFFLLSSKSNSDIPRMTPKTSDDMRLSFLIVVTKSDNADVRLRVSKTERLGCWLALTAASRLSCSPVSTLAIYPAATSTTFDKYTARRARIIAQLYQHYHNGSDRQHHSGEGSEVATPGLSQPFAGYGR
jgi:hypothetical protein